MPTHEHGGSRLNRSPLSRLVTAADVDRLRELFGAAVEDWLRDVPDLASHLAQAWHLEHVEPFTSTYYGGSSVLLRAASATHGQVLVKLFPPQHEGYLREAATLEAWGGLGAVPLLARDNDRQALLMPRLVPGSGLDPQVLGDDECTRAVIVAARVLAVAPTRAATGTLPGLDVWLADIDAHLVRYADDDPIGTDVVRAARATLVRLLQSTTERVVLHGDLHHDNVLRQGNRWMAIDPHGYIGDPAAEPATMLYNPIPYVFALDDPQLAALVEHRLDLWSTESELDPERVRAWGLVKSVVSEVWSAEDSGRATVDARVARLLAAAG